MYGLYVGRRENKEGSAGLDAAPELPLAAGTVQVLLCVLLSSEIDSMQLVWLCSLCMAMDLFMALQVRVCLR